jgi:hypothetical protein
VLAINDCCRVALHTGDTNSLKININEQGMGIVKGAIETNTALFDAAEQWGLKTAISLSIQRLLGQLADRHERISRELAIELRNGSSKEIQRTLAEQVSERADFLIPAMDVWSRIVMRDSANGQLFEQFKMEIDAALSRIEICSAIFRDLAALSMTGGKN